jgi:ABC-type transport system involved in multi-copper enzyme maturation permease subunit
MRLPGADLLRAEMIKLGRPLTWGVAGAAALFCVLLATGGAHNAAVEAAAPVGHIPACAELGIPAGPRCARAKALERARVNQVSGQAAQVAAQLSPAAAGAEAAGLMASLPGALALALLAGAHIGGEWSGRTLKGLLTQQGQRWRVLAAKLVSLWLAGAGLTAVCWMALAAAGPALMHTDHLPASHASAVHGLSLAGSQVARALLVLAAFAVIGLLAAVLTRSTIGTTAAAAGAVVAMLVAAALPAIGRWTPATWVQAWMGFPAGQASITSLPTNFWSRFISASGAPGHLTGLVGLAGLLAVCSAAAAAAFRRQDIGG